MNTFRIVLLITWCFTLNNYAQKQPNIILMMADDLGWGDTGFNGNEVILTPHLDQMAEDGIQFDRFYAASAVCSPTRASFLTGRNPYRTGVFSANRGIWASCKQMHRWTNRCKGKHAASELKE